MLDNPYEFPMKANQDFFFFPSSTDVNVHELTPGLRKRLMCLCSRAWFCWFPAQKFWRNSWASFMISCIRTSSPCRTKHTSLLHWVVFAFFFLINSPQTTVLTGPFIFKSKTWKYYLTTSAQQQIWPHPDTHEIHQTLLTAELSHKKSHLLIGDLK